MSSGSEKTDVFAVSLFVLYVVEFELHVWMQGWAVVPADDFQSFMISHRDFTRESGLRTWTPPRSKLVPVCRHFSGFFEPFQEILNFWAVNEQIQIIQILLKLLNYLSMDFLTEPWTFHLYFWNNFLYFKSLINLSWQKSQTAAPPSITRL